MSNYIESSSMTNDLGSSAHRYALASHDPDGVVRWSVGGEWSASLLDHSPTLMTGPEVDAFKVRHPNARIVDVIVYREACEVYSAGCNSVLDHSERSTPQTRQAAREAGIKALIRAGFPEDALNIVGPEHTEQAPAAMKLSNFIEPSTLTSASLLADGEVLGRDGDGGLIQWDASSGAPYNSGETVEEFALDNLSGAELNRLNLSNYIEQPRTSEADQLLTPVMRKSLEAAMVKVLDISTAHVPKHTADALDTPDSQVKPKLYDALSYVQYHEYGWIIHTSNDDQVRDSHPELARLIRMARELGAEHLKLDCDAPSIEGLPVFEWDSEPRQDASPSP